jgi:hypothetical protein
MKLLAFALLLLVFVGGAEAKAIDPSKRIEAAGSTSLVAFDGLDPDSVARDGGYVDVTSGAWSLGFMPASNQTIFLKGLNATTLTYNVTSMGVHTISSLNAPTSASTPFAYNATSDLITVIATAPSIWISWAPLAPAASGYWVVFVAVAAIIFLQLRGRK